MATTGTLINNVAYSWSMLQIESSNALFSESILSGVTAVKWNRKLNVATNYGMGGKPHTRGFGNWEYTASITLDYNGQAALRQLGGGSLFGLGEFNLTISWMNEYNTEGWIADEVVLQGCMFNEDGLEVSQDDTNITKEFDLNPFNIKDSNEAS